MSSATGLIIAAHALIARKAGEEWAIGQSDAELLVGAANNVLRHYPLRTTQLAMDWAMLGIACGTVYVPRYERWSARKRAEQLPRQPQPQPAAAAPVMPLTPPFYVVADVNSEIGPDAA